METCNIKITNIDDNKSLVSTSSNNTLKQHSTKTYIVPNTQKDEFVKNIQKKENKTSVLTFLLVLSSTITGAIAGYKLPVTRIDAKPYSSLSFGILGIIAGSLLGKAVDNFYTEKLLKKHNAEKI